MSKMYAIFVVLVISLSGGGCMTVQLSTDGIDKTVAMTSDVNKTFTIVRRFNQDLKGWFTLFNLITITDPRVSDLVRNELSAARGDAVINLRIQGQTTFVDGLIPIALGIVGGLAAPPFGFFASNLIGVRTYTVQGDIIKYSE